MKPAVDRDLQAIPQPYRKPLRSFLWHGVIPCDHDLLAVLCGEKHHPDMALVTAFLDKHADDLDIAHGHLGLVLRWQALGGMAGR